MTIKRKLGLRADLTHRFILVLRAECAEESKAICSCYERTINEHYVFEKWLLSSCLKIHILFQSKA